MAPTVLRSFMGVHIGRSLSVRKAAWRSICAPAQQCRWGSRIQRIHHTLEPTVYDEKAYYITTPIFYVNAAPHIGHLYTMVLADVLKRWQQIKGNRAYLLTGTDEHGMKIQQAAAKQAIKPKEMCDENSRKFQKLCEEGGLSHDHFIRTTDPDHKRAVEEFWTMLKNGLPNKMGLYKGKHEGWYSVDDECFYPPDLVEQSIVPQTGKKITVSSETGSAVEWISEETFFFPLTKYKDQLLKFYDENPTWVQPPSKMKEVRDWVENHLEDLSVTRPSARLGWGIKDPEDRSHTIYVWVDALINYLTATGYGESWHGQPPEKGLWPADLQIVGKDIIRFHAIYWPALLMALNLPMPRKILCHNHWTMSNRKMSKSVGNVVNPFFAIQRWGTDTLRYFLMRNGSLTKDMSYSNELIEMVYIKELQANIGNLYYRICTPKSKLRWSSREAVEAYVRGDFERHRFMDNSSKATAHFSYLESFIDEAPLAFRRAMDDNNVGKAIDEIFCLMREANRYVSDLEPWHLIKNTDMAETPILVNWTVYNACEALRVAAILLQPIMPEKATQLLDALAVSPTRRNVTDAIRGADHSYGLAREDPRARERVSPWETLFPPNPAATYSDQEVLDILAGLVESPGKSKMNRMTEWLAMEARIGEAGIRELALGRVRKGVEKHRW